MRLPRGTPLGSLQRVPMCGRGPGLGSRVSLSPGSSLIPVPMCPPRSSRRPSSISSSARSTSRATGSTTTPTSAIGSITARAIGILNSTIRAKTSRALWPTRPARTKPGPQTTPLPYEISTQKTTTLAKPQFAPNQHLRRPHHTRRLVRTRVRHQKQPAGLGMHGVERRPRAVDEASRQRERVVPGQGAQ